MARARGHAGAATAGHSGAQPKTQHVDEAHGIAPHLMVLAFCASG
jgi:hypothetical protein